MKIRAAFLLLLAVLSLSACGNKGPLVMPDPDAAVDVLDDDADDAEDADAKDSEDDADVPRSNGAR